jgi:anti-sigma factor RsiW
MECAVCRPRIHRFMDGECSYPEAAELRRHLDGCPACAAELAELEAARKLLAAWGRLELTPSAYFAKRVAVALEQASSGRRDGPLHEMLRRRLTRLDETLGRIPLPGGHTVPVRNLIGWGLAAMAVLIGLERHHVRRTRELRPSWSKGAGR